MNDEMVSVELNLERATLDDLALAAAAECRMTETLLVGALGHFMRLGEILLVARSRVADGGWISWLASVGVDHHATATKAMRLAHYRDRLPPEALQPWRGVAGQLREPTVNHALKYVRGLPDLHADGARKYPDSTRDEARRLRGTGMSFGDIASLLGCSRGVVRYWCDSAYAERKKVAARRSKAKALAARRALDKQERDLERSRLVRSVDDEFAKAYSHLRQAIGHLDRTTQGVEAMRLLHRAEDEIINAIRLGRRS